MCPTYQTGKLRQVLRPGRYRLVVPPCPAIAPKNLLRFRYVWALQCVVSVRVGGPGRDKGHSDQKEASQQHKSLAPENWVPHPRLLKGLERVLGGHNTRERSNRRLGRVYGGGQLFHRRTW